MGDLAVRCVCRPERETMTMALDAALIAALDAASEAEARRSPEAIHRGWCAALASAPEAVPTLDEVRAGRRMALQNTLLRLLWNLLREGLVDPLTARLDAVFPETGERVALADPETVQSLIYTRSSHAHVAIEQTLSDGTRVTHGDVLGFWRSVVAPAMAGHGDAYTRALVLREVTDSFRNEVHAMALQVRLYSRIVTAHPTCTNAWRWTVDPSGLSRWSAAEGMTVEAVIAQLASLHGHRLHPTAHARLRVQTGKDSVGRAQRAADGGAPVEALSLVEMLSNLGAAARVNLVPLAALRSDHAMARGLMQTADGTFTAADLAPEAFTSRVGDAFPEALARWRAWLAGLGCRPGDHVPLPLHPLNVPYLRQRYASWLDGGPGAALLVIPDPSAYPGVSIPARVGMSARTLMPVGERPTCHVKLALPVQVTSARRSLPPALALCAPGQTALLLNVLARDPALGAVLRVVPESAAVTVRGWQGDDEASRQRYRQGYFLSCVLREAPARSAGDGACCVPLAMLFSTSPFSHAPWYVDLLRARGITDASGALDAFAAHVDTVVRGPLQMFVSHGVVLEPHQQNMFLLFDRATGVLTHTLHRDFGDDMLSYLPLQRLQGHTLPGGMDVRSGTEDLLHDDPDPGTTPDRAAAIRGGLAASVRQVYHTLYTSHLGPMIDLLRVYFGVDPHRAHATVHAAVEGALQRARDGFHAAHEHAAAREAYDARWGAIRAMLHAPTVEAKGLFLARIEQSGRVPSVPARNRLAG